jgi:hypothetical protein
VVDTLGMHARRALTTHILAYDVAKRRGKALLALQALVRGAALRPHSPEVALRTVDFFATVKDGSGFPAPDAAAPAAPLHAAAAAVVAAEKGQLLWGHSSLEAYVDAFAARAQQWHSLPHTLAAARAQARIRPAQRGEAARAVVAALKGADGAAALRGLSVEGLQEALRVLEDELGAEAAVLAEARAACAERFPLAVAFK